MVLQGAQKSIQICLLVALFSTFIGTFIGAVSGYFRGWTDGVLMRFTDLILTIPLIALTAVLASRFQSLFGGWVGIAVVLIVFGWTTIARIVRAEFLSLREKEFVEAARAVGASDRRIIVRHILPNVAGVDHRGRHARHGHGHPGRDGAVVPRPRRQAARHVARACRWRRARRRSRPGRGSSTSPASSSS